MNNCVKRIQVFIDHIPLVNSFFSFSIRVWRKTFLQVLVLWIMSSLPILLQFVKKDHPPIETLFSTDILLVYTSAFVAPIIWNAVDLMRKASNHNDRGVRERLSSLNTYSGAYWWFLGGVIVLIFSAFTYGQKPEEFVFGDKVGYYVYIFAILLWMISLADGNKEGDFNSVVTADENHFYDLTRGDRS